MIHLLIINLIPFIYTPIMLRLLGQAEYGLYSIASSFMGYINLLDFGINGTIVRYIIKYSANDDIEGEQRMVGLFIKIYSAIGVAIMIAGVALAMNIEFYDRSLSSKELEQLRYLILLMTLNAALFLPLSPFVSVIVAHERFVLRKLISMSCGLVTPVLNLVLLYLGYGSIGLVTTTLILNALTYVAYMIYATKRLGIRPRFARAEKGVLREIVGYSFFVFISDIVNMLYWSTDKIIIGWAIGTVGTAVYNIGSSFNGYLTGMSTAISGVLTPRITSMAVKNTPKEEFTALFIKVGRLQFIVLSLVVSAFVAFGRQFIALWAGPEYEDAYAVALLTMLPVTIPLIQNTGLNMLYAMNKHRFRAIVYAVIAVVNAGLTFWWVEIHGIVGAAVATCIAYCAGHILVMNIYYHREIGIDIPLFWKNILKMSPVMLVMGTCWWFLLDRIGLSSWMMFLGLAVVYTVIYAVLAYFFMMNDYERNILTGPVKKLMTKLRKTR